MVDWIFHILLGQAVAIGAVLALVGLLGVKPNGYLVLSFASIELALLVQLAVSVGIVLAGQQAAVSTVEFFGYLFVALLIPLAGLAWALAEPTRWSTVVLGFAGLTVAIMLVRMQQIWTGIPFGG